MLGGLAQAATGLILAALVPSGVLLYPVVGFPTPGAGLAIPSVTRVISTRTSRQAQGSIQAVSSLALVLGPFLAGLAFGYVGVPAPYLLGGLLATLALLV